MTNIKSNTNPIDLSIIIISYNTKQITENCINSIVESLNNSSIVTEIIIIDNSSTDGSIYKIKNLELRIKNLKLIKNKENIGFAKANNQGVKEAKGKYVLFLNSDIVVLDSAISNLLAYFQKNEDRIHFLGGKLLNKDLSPQPSCGPFYSLPVIFAALFLRGDYWGLTRYSPNQEKEVDWVSGACILTKKKYYESINGFDENIFMYMDEIDLLYRAKQKGYRVFYTPTSKFIHFGSASSHNRTQPILQVYKGFLYFYKKHHDSRISLFLLHVMLQLKARISLFIGNLSGNRYLIETYEKALDILQMA